MKKIIAALTAVMLLLACLSVPAFAEEKKIKVVATIFPVYDWVRQIAGGEAGRIELTLLLDSGADLHNYQPTALDILTLAEADLFLYVGGESDGWVDRVVATAANPRLLQMNLMEALGDAVKEEETVEGMEHEHEHGEEEEEEPEADEHIWLSLRNAALLAPQIAESLGACDPDRAALYAANAASYADSLKALDARYAQAVESAKQKTVLFGDRFPFRYLADDYGLTYYAAFSGCSAETEASFQTVVFLSQKVDELGLGTILTIENPRTQLAQTIRENTKSRNQKILAMNSMQSVTGEDLQSGITYLSIMEENLKTLQEALQ